MFTEKASQLPQRWFPRPVPALMESLLNDMGYYFKTVNKSYSDINMFLSVYLFWKNSVQFGFIHPLEIMDMMKQKDVQTNFHLRISRVLLRVL